MVRVIAMGVAASRGKAAARAMERQHDEQIDPRVSMMAGRSRIRAALKEARMTPEVQKQTTVSSSKELQQQKTQRARPSFSGKLLTQHAGTL